MIFPRDVQRSLMLLRNVLNAPQTKAVIHAFRFGRGRQLALPVHFLRAIIFNL